MEEQLQNAVLCSPAGRAPALSELLTESVSCRCSRLGSAAPAGGGRPGNSPLRHSGSDLVGTILGEANQVCFLLPAFRREICPSQGSV